MVCRDVIHADIQLFGLNRSRTSDTIIYIVITTGTAATPNRANDAKAKARKIYLSALSRKEKFLNFSENILTGTISITARTTAPAISHSGLTR